MTAAVASPLPTICPLCGGGAFGEREVLWDALAEEWQLSAAERAYVDRQQGTHCLACGANLRTMALAQAILTNYAIEVPLIPAADSACLDHVRILDCNDAGIASNALQKCAQYTRADYPNVDIHALPFAPGSFDLVIHSDTLEHVAHPVLALEECRRVLSEGGRLIYTVPIIVGRLTRNRTGLPPSYHGDASCATDDMRVITEFGADAWTFPLQAGFTNASFNQIAYPAAMAITAWTQAEMTPASAPLAEAQPAPPSVEVPHPIYDQDGLRSVHNHEFIDDAAFQSAYARGVQAAGVDYRWHWRVHTGLWAARTAALLQGDFIEFGVNRGFLSSAIMAALDWNATGRSFWLLDTFTGIDSRYVTQEDLDIGVLEHNQAQIDNGFYTFDVDTVRANFAEWPEARIVQGPVPETLAAVESEQFAFAHLDMNCAGPEIAAAEWLWPRLVPGGLMLLDDYAYSGYRSQKLAMDAFAASKGAHVLSLPTGQGLIVRPPT